MKKVKRAKSVLVVNSTRAEYGNLRPQWTLFRDTRLVTLARNRSHTLRDYGYTKREIERDG
jgi:hypothetical protein